MQTFYWLLLLPFVLFTILLELIQTQKTPDPRNVVRRVIISIILLLSFKECMATISILSNGIAGKISGIYTYDHLILEMKTSFSKMSASWFKIKEATIYIITLATYILAYVGVFMSNALVYFVWSVLYISAPLMILMYVHEKTAFVTKNLYKGLINVGIWKVFYSIMGVMLLNFSKVNAIGDEASFLTAIIVNLCIATSMLFTPFAVKSLLNDGMTSVGAAYSMVPSVAIASGIKYLGRKLKNKVFSGKKGKKGSKGNGNDSEESQDSRRNNQPREEEDDE